MTGLTDDERIHRSIRKREEERKRRLQEAMAVIERFSKLVLTTPICFGSAKVIAVDSVRVCSKCQFAKRCSQLYIAKEVRKSARVAEAPIKEG